MPACSHAIRKEEIAGRPVDLERHRRRFALFACFVYQAIAELIASGDVSSGRVARRSRFSVDQKRAFAGALQNADPARAFGVKGDRAGDVSIRFHALVLHLYLFRRLVGKSQGNGLRRAPVFKSISEGGARYGIVCGIELQFFDHVRRDESARSNALRPQGQCSFVCRR